MLEGRDSMERETRVLGHCHVSGRVEETPFPQYVRFAFKARAMCRVELEKTPFP